MTEIARIGPFATHEAACAGLRARGYSRNTAGAVWKNHRAARHAWIIAHEGGFSVQVWHQNSRPPVNEPVPGPQPVHELYKSRPEAEADLIAQGFRYSKRRRWMENDLTGEVARVQKAGKCWVQIIQDDPEYLTKPKAVKEAPKPLRERLVVPQPRRRAIRIIE